jgi:hypothetical protein
MQLLQRVAAARGLADFSHAGLCIQELANPGANHGMIVGYQNS